MKKREAVQLAVGLRVGVDAGLLYTGTRACVKAWAKVLAVAGVSVASYHGGMSPAAKEAALRRWQSGECCWMVCTEAFGMGVNKSNVRLVLHVEVPTSMMRYAQEVGRGGRDGEACRCVILWREVDGHKVKKRAGSASEVREAQTMIEFCEQQEQCRKACLKRYFHEELTSPRCSVCDVCTVPRAARERRDCRDTALEILRVASRASAPGVSFSKLCAAVGVSGAWQESLIRKVVEVMLREEILVEQVAGMNRFRSLVFAPGAKAHVWMGSSCRLDVFVSAASCTAAGRVGAQGVVRQKKGPRKSQYPCPHCGYSTALKMSRFGGYRQCSQQGCGWKRPATAGEEVILEHGAKSVTSYLGATLRKRWWAGSPSKRPHSGRGQVAREGQRRLVEGRSSGEPGHGVGAG